jgi:tetratricopeptide (TPR) repeat protein
MNIQSTLRKGFEALAVAFALLPVALPAIAQEAPFSAELSGIQQSWDEANYRSSSDAEKQRRLEELSARSEALVRKYPRHAEPLVWEGIVLSSYAGAKGGLGALSLAKRSRDCLVEATKIDPAALRGSAYTSLGALYYKVPGWPVGFGDEDKATDFLRKALAINPEGMDPNYFIGELLFEQGEYSRSLQHLQKALSAPPRADRPIADAGRRAEVDTLMARVRAKLQ